MRHGALLARNVAWNFLGTFWLLSLGLFATPVIIRGLGEEAYGILALLGVLAAYLNLLELGVASALVKTLSEDACVGSSERSARALRSSLGWALAVGTAGGSAIALLATPLSCALLKPSSALAAPARIALLITAAHFPAGMLYAWASAIPVAHQRFDLSNLMTTLLVTLSLLSSVAVLSLGGGLPGVAAANLGSTLIALAAALGIARRLRPDLPLRPSWDPPELRRLLKFGGWMAAGGIAVECIFPLNRLLIGAFLSAGALTFYQVPFDLSLKIKQFALNVSRVFFPAASEAAARSDGAALGQILIRGTRAVLAATMPLPLLAALWGRPFLELWLGPKFAAQSALPLALLACAMFAYFSTSVAGSVIQGMGRPRDWALFAFGVAVVNASIALFGIPAWGITGAALALLAASVLGASVFLAATFRSLLGSAAGRAAFGMALGLAPAALALAAWLAYARPFIEAQSGVPLLSGIAWIAAAAAPGLFAYVLLVAFLGFDASDRRAAAEALRRLFRPSAPDDAARATGEAAPPVVLHLVSHLTTSGVTKVLETLATGLQRRGWRNLVAYWMEADDLADRLRAAGIPVVALRAPGPMPGPIGRLLLRFRLRSLLHREGVRIVQAYSFDADLVGLAAAGSGGPPVFSSVQSRSYADWVREHADRYRRDAPRFAGFACASGSLASDLAATGVVSRDRMSVIWNATGPEFDLPRDDAAVPALRQALGAVPGDRIIAMVANFHPVKGHRTLLEAFSKVLSNVPEARLVLVGGDGSDPERIPIRRDIEALAAAPEFRGRVLLAGPRRDIRALLDASDLFVLPSREEGMGLSIAEAMSRGLAVVATRVGGIPEVVEDGVTGILVPPNDPEALAKAISGLLKDPEARTRMGEAGRARARALFSPESLVDAYERLYRSQPHIPS